jgi:hypothetical protein
MKELVIYLAFSHLNCNAFNMLFLICTFLIATVFAGQTVAQFSDPSMASFKMGDPEARSLGAITVRSELEKREVNFAPKYTLDHHYADRICLFPCISIIIVTYLLLDKSLTSSASARFAKTCMSYKLPALALEDIESHLENIKCSDSVIVLEFVHEVILEQARKEWDDLSEFIAISSHPGCNGDGERAPYV